LQHLMAGLGSFIAGMVVTKNALNGQLLNYHYVGLISVFVSIMAVVISLKLKTFDGRKF